MEVNDPALNESSEEIEYRWDGENKVSFVNSQGYIVTRSFFTKQIAIEFLKTIS